MKKSLMEIGALMLFACCIVGTSFAGPRNAVEAANEMTQARDNAASEEWHAALSEILETDEEYAVAADHLKAFTGQDEEEHASLKTALDARYYELARSVYEDYFGAWKGDDDEFIVLLTAADQERLIRVCTDSATTGCGEGNVKKVTLSAEGACSYECFAQRPVAGG